MAGRISFECPSCSTKLSVSDPSKLGKKIKCPKCQEVFLPEAPEAPEDEELNVPMDDFDDEADDEPDQPVIKRRSSGGGKAAAKGNKPQSSSGGGNNLPLVIGGGVGVLVLVIVGVVFSGALSSKPLQAPPNSQAAPGLSAAPEIPPPVAPPHAANASAPTSSPSPPQLPGMSIPAASPSSAAKPTSSSMTAAEKVLGLRWMPADTDLVIHAKVADILDAPLLKGLLNNPSATEAFKEFEKRFGLQPSQFQSVTIGVADPSGLGSGMIAEAPASRGKGLGPSPIPGIRLDEARVIAVVKLKESIDLSSLSQKIPNASLKDKNGKQYLEVPADLPGMPGFGIWSADSKTLIAGTTKELIESIDRGETSVPRKELASIDAQPQFLIANFIHLPDAEIVKKMEAQPNQIPGFMMKTLETYDLKLASLGLSVKGGINFQFSAVTGSREGATKFKSELQSNLETARTSFAASKAMAPPLLADLGNTLLTSAKIEDLNQTVKVSMAIPDSEQAKLEQLPAIVMMMAMTGGLPPGFGPTSTSKGKPDDSVVKQPGETEPVVATTVEGLPEGMTLTARSAWSFPLSDTPIGRSDICVEVLIDVAGDGLETVCAATGATLKKGTLDASGSLKKSRRTLFGDIDSQKTFLPFDFEEVLPFEHPTKTLRVRLAVDSPTSNAKKIEVLEGSFKYMTAAESHPMTIENAPRRSRRPLADPEFKAGSVKLRRGESAAVPETLKLECAKTHYIGRATGTPGDAMSYTEVDKGSTIQRFYCTESDGKFPDDFQIDFKLYADLKEQVVTFRFENIPLPSAESKPGAQPEIKP